MNLTFVLRDEAVDDLLAARHWYENQRPELAGRFEAQVSVAFQSIANRPELHPILERDVRVRRLHRFPYLVYYRVLSDRVVVVAVLHGNRDASAWRSRR